MSSSDRIKIEDEKSSGREVDNEETSCATRMMTLLLGVPAFENWLEYA